MVPSQDGLQSGAALAGMDPVTATTTAIATNRTIGRKRADMADIVTVERPGLPGVSESVAYRIAIGQANSQVAAQLMSGYHLRVRGAGKVRAWTAPKYYRRTVRGSDRPL